MRRFHLLLGLLGHRGEALLIFGFLFILIGLSGELDPLVGVPTTPHVGLFYYTVPVTWRFVAWTLTGLLAISAAWRRTPPRSDSWGWVALMIMPLFNAFSYTWSFVLYLIGQHGYATGWVGIIFWGFLFSRLLMNLASWPESAHGRPLKVLP